MSTSPSRQFDGRRDAPLRCAPLPAPGLLALLATLILALALLAGSCAKPDLGASPVYCNLYEPRCPAGYACVRGDGAYEICLSEGTSRTPAATDGGAEEDGATP